MSNVKFSSNKPIDRRVGVLIHSCDGEIEIGREALKSLIDSLGPEYLFIQIIDDASKAQVGEHLAEFCRELGAKAHCHRLDQPLGYRGCIARTMLGLRLLANHQPVLDCVVKIDADTLVLRPEFGRFVQEHCIDTDSLWGVIHELRLRDLVLLMADLLPMGFRRKRINGQIQRKWELRRLLPVWWTDIGIRAILHRTPINRIATGGVYVLAGPLLQRMKQRGYLDREVNRRYGFVTSEEDTMVSLISKACGARIIDFNTIRPNLATTRLVPNTTAQEIFEAGYAILHPLKANERDNRLRYEIANTLRTFANPNSVTLADDESASHKSPSSVSGSTAPVSQGSADLIYD